MNPDHVAAARHGATIADLGSDTPASSACVVDSRPPRGGPR